MTRSPCQSPTVSKDNCRYSAVNVGLCHHWSAPLIASHEDFDADDEEFDDDDSSVDRWPPDVDDPAGWDDFGADLDTDEPLPETGDFWTEDDGDEEV